MSSTTLSPTPSAAPSGASHYTADSLPVLTTDVIAKMTTFWASFKQEPLAIRDTAPEQYRKLLSLPSDTATVGRASFDGVDVVDMVAIAQQYPAVAKDFDKAGLTPQQWDQDRIALYSAIMAYLFTSGSQYATGLQPPAITTVLGQNVAFVAAHQQEIAALQAVGMGMPDDGRKFVPINTRAKN